MFRHEINTSGDGYEGYYSDVTAAALAVLEHEKIYCTCEVNIEFTDNAGIQKMNKSCRAIDEVTDVLSFQMGEINPESGVFMLGDILISGEKAKAQSIEINQSLKRELMFLTVHAVLHLLGYEHEASEECELIMRRKQREIMEKF
ncbi:MAG: rRNA maturation RNase YbeY [Oscillospiraceae bacterium]|nr:rRNA maturation RNase YbeY [Oscillospiraceae bacterium]